MTQKFSSSTTANAFTLVLTLTEKSTDVSTNTSLVGYELKLTSGGWDFINFGIESDIVFTASDWASEIRIATTRRPNAPVFSLNKYSSVVIAAGEVALPHSADGSLTTDIAFSMGMKEMSFTPGAISVTGKTMTFSTIPRASAIGATDAAIGSATMVAVGRKSDRFTHSVAYQFGSAQGYISPEGQAVAQEVKHTVTGIAFTLPESFYSQIPNGKSGTCVLTCRTYEGNTRIGAAQQTSFTVYTREELCKPSVSMTVADTRQETLALTGDENILIRYESTPRCEITAAAQKGASLVSQTVNGAGQTEFPQTETGAFTAVVTDSRGYSASAVVEKTLIPYVRLTANPTLRRLAPTDSNVELTITGDCYGGSFGAQENRIQVQYRIDSGAYQAVDPTVTGNGYQVTAVLSDLDYTKTHTLTVQVTDCLDTVTKKLPIQRGIPVFDWGEADFNFHVPVSVNGVEQDAIVEQKKGVQWTWRKWESGIAECWTTITGTIDVDFQWGSLYTSGSDSTTIGWYPFSFAESPTVEVGYHSNGAVNFWLLTGSAGNNTRTPNYKLVRSGTPATNVYYALHFRAIGRWK